MAEQTTCPECGASEDKWLEPCAFCGGVECFVCGNDVEALLVAQEEQDV